MGLLDAFQREHRVVLHLADFDGLAPDGRRVGFQHGRRGFLNALHRLGDFLLLGKRRLDGQTHGE